MKFFFTLASFLALSVASPAQTITYTRHAAVSKGIPTYQADLNGDGVSDIISDGHANPDDISSQSGFYVNLSNGDGTYQEPVFYTTPQPASQAGIVTGDFNRDGSADIVDVTNGPNIYFFRNNGNGVFTMANTQAKDSSGIYRVQAADFNRDGKLDLAFLTFSGKVVVANGNGDGTFGAPRVIGTPSNGADLIFVGDYDADGKADIVTAWAHCDRSVGCRTFIYSFYGDGAGNFAAPALTTYTSDIYFNSMDVNGDGRRDLAGINGEAVNGVVMMRILYGNANRTFTVRDVPLGKGAGVPPFEAADINGDGVRDLAIPERDSTSAYVAVLLGNPDGGYKPEQYIYQDVNLRGVLTGRYNTGTRPDLMAFVSPQAGSGKFDFLINTTSGNFPGCDAPRSAFGIRVCSPSPGSTAASPVRFSIGSSFTSPLRKLELWIDGSKRKEMFNTYSTVGFLDASMPVASGAHTATFYAVSFDGLKTRTSVNFNVSGSASCPAPSSLGVNICSPGTSSSSPVTVSATGKTANSTIGMELWVDGAKKLSAAGSHISGSIAEPAGSHRFSFYAIDSSGGKINKVETVTVH